MGGIGRTAWHSTDPSCPILPVLPVPSPVLPVFFALAPGPHPRRELTLMRRRRLCLAATAAWPQAPPTRLPYRPSANL